MRCLWCGHTKLKGPHPSKRCRRCKRITSKPRHYYRGEKIVTINIYGFKTPGELSLTQNQYDTLIEVLERFESGAVKDLPPGHHSAKMGTLAREEEDQMQFFDYDRISLTYDCGSAGCIYGWCRALDPLRKFAGAPYFNMITAGEFGNSSEDIPEQFTALCFGNWRWMEQPIDRSRVELAAAAVRHYLTTGIGVTPLPEEKAPCSPTLTA